MNFLIFFKKLTTKLSTVTPRDTSEGGLYIHQNYQHIYIKKCGFGSYARIRCLKHFFVKREKVILFSKKKKPEKLFQFIFSLENIQNQASRVFLGLPEDMKSSNPRFFWKIFILLKDREFWKMSGLLFSGPFIIYTFDALKIQIARDCEEISHQKYHHSKERRKPS